jgi:hypothetical protein
MLVSLSLAAGCVDAVGYLGFDQVHVAITTGNTVLLGLAVGQEDEQAALHAGIALARFICSVAVGADHDEAHGRVSDTGQTGKKSYILGERRIVYWYNPKSQTSERRPAPSTDEQAIDMLSGDPNSAEFVSEYAKLRDSGVEIEQALILVGHEFRLRQPEYQLVLR